MLRQRILTAALLIPAFLGGLFLLPEAGWVVCVAALTAIAAHEWSRLTRLPPLAALLFVALCAGPCLALYAHPVARVTEVLLAAGVVFWIVIAPWLLVTRSRHPSAWPWVASGWLVLAAASVALVALRASPPKLLALLVVVWVADSSAYFVGRRFGRTKLAPTISPGKTWEGVGGAALAVAVYFFVVWIIVAPPFLGASRLTDAVLVGAMTALSVEGDLFESWLKRRAGAKDSGGLLPGHGGILDRIDGILAVLPIAAIVHIGPMGS